MNLLEEIKGRIETCMDHIEALDEKLSFLTEVFCITEDLRDMLGGDQDMEKSRAILVRAREGRETLQGDPGLQDAPEGDAK